MAFNIEIPKELAHLKTDSRGYPVPYFVSCKWQARIPFPWSTPIGYDHRAQGLSHMRQEITNALFLFHLRAARIAEQNIYGCSHAPPMRGVFFSSMPSPLSAESGKKGQRSFSQNADKRERKTRSRKTGYVIPCKGGQNKDHQGRRPTVYSFQTGLYGEICLWQWNIN